MKTKSPLLKITPVPLGDLIEDPANPRKHDQRNLAAIRSSLQRFGQVEPLVVQDSTMQVVGGNGRLTVMRELGWEMCDVVKVKLDNTEAAALSIVLNRSTELGEWDLEALSGHIGALFDTDLVDVLGFSEGEISNFMGADWGPEKGLDGDLDDHQRKDGSGDDDGGDDKENVTLCVSGDQFSLISQALDRLREDRNDKRITVGVAMAVFAERYLVAK